MKISSTLVSLLALAFASTPAQTALSQEAPEVIVVTGRQPGPPLWRVSNGDNVLWIFAYLNPIPQDMQWDSERVAGIIARSQAYLPLPGADVSISPFVQLNPINIVRGIRLAGRLRRNPEDKTLQDVLPQAAYQRFAALKAMYFAGDRGIEELRPLPAGVRMSGIVLEKVGLGSADHTVMKTIERLARRNRGMKRFDTEVEVELEGNYRSLADRVETLMNSISPEQELACFEWQLGRMESDLDAMKSRANSWARGYVDELRGVALAFSEQDPCLNLLLASSEKTTFTDILQRSEQRWLDSADEALTSYPSTFAVLPVSALVGEQGTLAKLRAKGYQVREPLPE